MIFINSATSKLLDLCLQLSDFLPVLRLYDLLYQEREALVVPDITKPYCVSQMAATCIWIHILKKAQTENQLLTRPLPTALKKHYDYLQSIAVANNAHPTLNVCDFRVALLANAFSTNSELFSRYECKKKDESRAHAQAHFKL